MDANQNMIEHLLAPPDPGDGGEPLRELVLTQTLAALRSRRRIKRVGAFSMLAACYVAGAATVCLWSAGSPNPVDTVAEEAPPPTPIYVAMTPADDPLLTNEPPFERLRNVGDRKLLDDGDVAGAVRAYRQAIAIATAEQRAIQPDQDTGLLMALKLAYNKEPEHDENPSQTN